MSHSGSIILPVGTQVVTSVDLRQPGGEPDLPRGAVGVVVVAPTDAEHSYRVRFVDGREVALRRSEIAVRSVEQRAGLERSDGEGLAESLYDHVIYRCVVGSRAYGLAGGESDVDRRGIYLPPADLHWSLAGVPEQLERPATEECYWEARKFLTLALKANPNILECLYSPLVEKVTPLGEQLLAMRECFLSQMIFQTFNGYAMSQFKKIEQDLRNHGEVRWKHAMHLLRLLLTGAATLRQGRVPVHVEAHRDRLLAVKRGEQPWPDVNAWRRELHHDFEVALAATRLPERPDYEAANRFLVQARRDTALRKP